MGIKNSGIYIEDGRKLFKSKAYLSLTGKSSQVYMILLCKRIMIKISIGKRKTWTAENNGKIQFTYKEARRAGLINKAGPWKEYPQRQFMWRAVGFLAKDKFSDVLGNFPIDEEARDYKPIEKDKPSPITSRPEHPPPSKPDSLLEALEITPKTEEPVDVTPEVEDKPEPAKAEKEQSGTACKHGNLDSDFCQECSTEADIAIASRDE